MIDTQNEHFQNREPTYKQNFSFWTYNLYIKSAVQPGVCLHPFWAAATPHIRVGSNPLPFP